MAVKTDTQATTLPAQERKPQETIDSGSRGDIPLRWVTSILLLVFPTATLFLNRGDSYVLGLLTLIGIWVWLRDGARRWLDRPSALLWIAFVLFFAVALLSYLLGTQTDAGFRFLGRYLRFLLIVPVYLALRRYPPTAKTVFIGLALGALLAGVVGALHVYHADTFIRIEATTGLPIIFGDLATTMTLCVIAGFGLLAMSRGTWAVPLLVLCIAGGIAAALLSGARGAWIPLLLLPSLLVTRFGGFVKTRYAFVVILVLVAVFSSFYFVAQSGTKGRIDDVIGGVRDYFLGLKTANDVDRPFQVHCISNRAFLDAWVKWYSKYKNPDLYVRVAADPMLRDTGLCRDSYSVILHNRSSSTLVYGFHRIPREEQGERRTTLLVRGAGTLKANGSVAAGVSFDAHDYLKLNLSMRDSLGDEIVLYVPGDRTAYIVPLEGYYGEYSGTVMDTSMGQRLEMWWSAWRIFERYPIFGIGTGAYQQGVKRLIAANQVVASAGQYDHPHSDYFNALASAGIVGLLSLLAIFGLPVYFFIQVAHQSDRDAGYLSLSGLLTVASFAIFALTDTIFLHSMMITWYVVYMALFYALLSTQASKLTKPEPVKP